MSDHAEEKPAEPLPAPLPTPVGAPERAPEPAPAPASAPAPAPAPAAAAPAPAVAPPPVVESVIAPAAAPDSGEDSPRGESLVLAKVPARQPSFIDRLDLPLTLGALVVGVVLLAIVQLSTPQLIDHDSLYHVQAARQLVHTGDNIVTKRLFPWMQGTFLRDHYADKELLFHVYLMPFCSETAYMDANAKIATIALDAFVLLAFVLALRGAGIRHAWLWLLLLLGAGENFTYRLLETRPHVLSIGLVLLAVRFLLQRRTLPLYIVGFVLAWSYSGPQVLPAFALAALVARWAREGSFTWKPFAAATLGVAGGLVLNPFVPNNLYLWRVQNVDVLLRAWGVTPGIANMGGELYPYTTRELLTGSPGFCLTLALAAGALLLATRRPSVRTVTIGGMALASLVALLASAKFLDYAAPLAVLFAASAVDDQWRGGERSLRRAASGSVFVVAVIALALFATARTQKLVARFFANPPRLRTAAAWLASNARGATVIHFDWNDFSTLFHDNPESFYLFGLDPTFAEVWNPEVIRYLEDIRHGNRPLVARWFAENKAFSPKARFIVVKQNTDEAAACFTTELQSADLKKVFEDDNGAVFQILGD